MPKVIRIRSGDGYKKAYNSGLLVVRIRKGLYIVPDAHVDELKRLGVVDEISDIDCATAVEYARQYIERVKGFRRIETVLRILRECNEQLP